MKKNLLPALILVLFVFAGCEKDDSSNTFDIEISNVEGSFSNVSEIRAVGMAMEQTIASMSLTKMPLAIKLPAKAASKYLVSIGDYFSGGLFDISDASARWTEFVDLYGYGSGGSLKGQFIKVLFPNERTIQYTCYCYADKDVTITGEYTGNDQNGNEVECKVDLSLKAGWNTFLEKYHLDGSIYEEEELNTVKFEMVSSSSAIGYWLFLSRNTE